jgi:hypothetical protein
MNFEIRAMSLAEILDTGFQLVKNRFALLAGVSLLGQAPGIILLSAISRFFEPLSGGSEDLTDIGASLIAFGALYLLATMLLFPFVISAVVKTVGDLYLGRQLTFGDVVRSGLSRMLPLLVTYVVFVLVSGVIMVLGIAAVMATVGVISAALGEQGALGGAVVVLLVIAGIFASLAAGLIYFVASLIVAAVVVLEEISLFEAIARTWILVTSAPTRAIGVALTVYLIVAVPAVGVQFLVGVLPFLGALLSGAVQAVGYAYMFATTVVLYFDIRCRRESFDLEYLARMVEGREPSAVGPAF